METFLEWDDKKAGEQKDNVQTRIQRHEKLAVKANGRGDANKRRYHLDKIREIKNREKTKDESVDFMHADMHVMLEDLYRAGVDLSSAHLAMEELHTSLKLNESKFEPSEKSVGRIQQLARMGLVSKNLASLVQKVIAKVEAGATSFSQSERKALSELLDNLVGLVTGDDTTYQRIRQSVSN